MLCLEDPPVNSRTCTRVNKTNAQDFCHKWAIKVAIGRMRSQPARASGTEAGAARPPGLSVYVPHQIQAAKRMLAILINVRPQRHHYTAAIDELEQVVQLRLLLAPNSLHPMQLKEVTALERRTWVLIVDQWRGVEQLR